MLDRNTRIAGYLLRPSPTQAGTGVSGPALLAALENERVGQLIERRKAIIPLTGAQWHAADFSAFARPNAYFLLTSPDTAAIPTLDWENLATRIRAAGGGIAAELERFMSPGDSAQLANCLLLNLTETSLVSFEQQLADIRRQHPELLLVVDGVGSWSEYRYLLSLGISLCIGPFATTPDDTEQSNQISQSRLVLIEMLNMLRGDGEITEIATVAKRDPAVVVKLLEMANSPLSGLTRRVASLEDAIILLGRDALYRWLSLAMFRVDSRGNRDETLMVIALSRASFLERLASNGNRQVAGELFLVGLLSLIDSLLSMPIEKVLEKMHLPAPVASVLLRNEGPYARYLSLAFAMERCRIDQALNLCSVIGLDPTAMMTCYSESIAWASLDESA